MTENELREASFEKRTGDAVSIPLTKRQWYQHGFDDGIAHADLTEQLAAMTVKCEAFEACRVALQNLVHTVEKSSLIAAVWMGSGRRDAEIEQIVGAKNIAIATLKAFAALDTQPQGEGADDGK